MDDSLAACLDCGWAEKTDSGKVDLLDILMADELAQNRVGVKVDLWAEMLAYLTVASKDGLLAAVKGIWMAVPKVEMKDAARVY